MVVDLFKATKEELKMIKGIGDKTAEKILALRNADNLTWPTLLQAASNMSAADITGLMDKGEISFVPFPTGELAGQLQQ
jgi:DNA uptake protein ComE-like DNA-binding protein